MRTAILLTFLLILAYATTYINAQEAYVTITLEADPPDCVVQLIGAGTYRAGEQVRIEVKPSMNCGFIEWRTSGALNITTSANPFFFYAPYTGERVTVKALLERLYTDPEKGVVPRIAVIPKLNVTLPENLMPAPFLTLPGKTVRYVFPQEITLADMKYVFLYAEVDGRIFDTPETSFTAPDTGEVTLNAYYYTYRRFLGEYYPINQFVRVNASVEQVSQSERRVPTSITVLQESFPLDQPVPKQLLHLVKVQYKTQYLITLAVNGHSPSADIDGSEVLLSGVLRLWRDSGSMLTIVFPERDGKYRLKTLSGQGVQVYGSTAAGTVTGPVFVVAEYQEAPNGVFLDIPIAGTALYTLAEYGSRLYGLEGMPALAAMIATIAGPPAIASATIKLKGSVRVRAGGRGGRARSREDSIQPILLLTSNPTQSDVFQNVNVSGRIVLRPELVEALQTVKNMEAEAVEAGEEPDEKLPYSPGDGEELIRKALAGEKVKLEPYHICDAEWDEEGLKALGEAVEEGRVKVGDDFGFYGLHSTGRQALSAVRNPENLSLVVESPDAELGARIMEKACVLAGLKTVRLNISATDPKKAAEEVRKKAGGASAVVFTPQPSQELAVVQSALTTRKLHVLVSPKPSIKPMLTVKQPFEADYQSIAVALLAQRKILSMVSMEHVARLAELAYALKGLETLEKSVEELGELLKRGVEAGAAVAAVTRRRIAETFHPEELELLTQTPDIKQLMSAYISLVRQLRPGADPLSEWGTFYTRLKRLGLVIEE